MDGNVPAIRYHTAADWDEAMWRRAEPVYNGGFPEHGRKPVPVIRRMFKRRMCVLHTMECGGETVGMALCGKDPVTDMLVLDYLTVEQAVRGRGCGRKLLGHIREWAEREARCRGILVEVEAEPTEENRDRIRFWERCGFRLTAYVHHYIWVPEPYRAMYLMFDPEEAGETDGRILFEAITRFHEKAYRK